MTSPSSSVAKLFQDAGWMLQPNCDDEGSCVDARVLDRARGLLEGSMDRIPSLGGLPVVGLGPDNSVDLHWRTPRMEMVVNVPAADGVPVTFFLDDGGHGAFELQGQGTEADVIGAIHDGLQKAGLP